MLVIDDDPASVGLVRDALEDEGYKVVTAANGAVLPLAHDLRPSVILLDVMMPHMDGLEVSRHLRADPATARIPIIATSPQHNLDALDAVVARLPVNDHLAKPFDRHQLYATVARWAHVPVEGRIRWQTLWGRSFAFDCTTRQVVALCSRVFDIWWWVFIRHPAAAHGPFETLEQARAAAERHLLA